MSWRMEVAEEVFWEWLVTQARPEAMLAKMRIGVLGSDFGRFYGIIATVE